MILYLSNFLSLKNRTPQPCEFIVGHLKKEYEIIHQSSNSNFLRRVFDEVFALFKYRNKIELVIIDLYAYRSYYLACLCGFICQLLKLKYITVLHSHELVSKFNQQSFLLLNFLRHAHMSIAPSLFFAKILHKNNLQVQLIHNPIDLNLYSETDIQSDTPKMLWVRTIHPKYNPLLAIEILKRVRDKHSEATLTMVGPFTEPTFTDCKKLVNEYGLTNHITFTGYLSKKDWIPLAKNHNVFINTTNLDNAPVSLIEAAALGLPIVSTNVGGIPDLFENNHEVLLVNPNDDTAFANAVISLFDNPSKTAQMKNNALHKAKQMDWSKIKEKWKLLLEQEGINPVQSKSN